ncbi:MAG: DoxX family protein [Cyclobacteriaceae bacterium]|jgi:uncharacterized membrane protein YphA (DoxX/SURF4 family)|nr:DoxX family protein [Cyclobacteriaceae bacterium]
MKTKIHFVLNVLMGLLFINGGLNKFFNYMPVPPDLPEATLKDFGAFMEIAWLMPLVGVAELVGGVLILLPKTRALGTLVLFPIVVGIVLMHVVVDASGLPIALIIAAIIGWNIADHWKKYLGLLH